MAKQKTTVAVIGAGAISQRRHLREYAARNDVEIIAVVDINAKRAKEVAANFNIPNAFTDYRDALKLKPQAVSVCTPNAFHAEHTIAALKAGAHVLCEKPMGVSIKELKAMNAAAAKAKRQLMVGQNQRFNASHRRGQEIIASGQLGKVLAFSTTFAHKGPEFWSVDGLNCHFFKKDQSVLGSLADLGVHKIDLIRFLLGQDIASAAAMTGTLEKKKCGVEDTAFAVLATTGGVLGQMFAGWVMKPNSDNSTVIYAEKGTMRLEDDPEFTVIVDFADRQQMCLKTQKIQTNEAGGQSGSGVINAFIEAIRNGRKVPISGADAAKSVAAVLACVESAKTGRTVKVAKV